MNPTDPAIERLMKERDMWKANHDNQLLRDRPDLGERAALVDKLVKERDALLAELRSRGCCNTPNLTWPGGEFVKCLNCGTITSIEIYK